MFDSVFKNSKNMDSLYLSYHRLTPIPFLYSEMLWQGAKYGLTQLCRFASLNHIAIITLQRTPPL